MSKLRMRIKLAEEEYKVDPETGYYIFNDGKVIDPETGEVISENGNSNSWKDNLKDLMFEEKPRAYKDFPGENYKNQWGKVSPLNVLFVDRINELYAMDPQMAKDTIIQTMEDMNNKYGYDDDSYSYMSKEYINKTKASLSKLRSIDKVVEFLTNAYFKGMGMGSSKSYASVTLDLNNKKVLAMVLPILNKIAGKKED